MKSFFVLGALACGGFSYATQYVFSSGSITIPDLGVANLSPVSFLVAGLDGTISDVNIRFNNITHEFSEDIGAVLFNPSNIGTLLFDAPGQEALTNVTWTFDDSAASMLSNTGANPSGTYKPGQNQWNDPFTGAPAGPYGTLLSTYNGTNGAGTWRLFIEDFVDMDGGSIGGVDLIINTNPVPEPATLAALALGGAALLRRRRK